MHFLEDKFLNDGSRGLNVVKKEMQKILLNAMSAHEALEEDIKKDGYEGWLNKQVQKAIFNPMVSYTMLQGEVMGPFTNENPKPNLLCKVENWAKQVNTLNRKGRALIPLFVQEDLVDKIVLQ